MPGLVGQAEKGKEELASAKGNLEQINSELAEAKRDAERLRSQLAEATEGGGCLRGELDALASKVFPRHGGKRLGTCLFLTRSCIACSQSAAMRKELDEAVGLCGTKDKLLAEAQDREKSIEKDYAEQTARYASILALKAHYVGLTERGA